MTACPVAAGSQLVRPRLALRLNQAQSSPWQGRCRSRRGGRAGAQNRATRPAGSSMSGATKGITTGELANGHFDTYLLNVKGRATDVHDIRCPFMSSSANPNSNMSALYRGRSASSIQTSSVTAQSRGKGISGGGRGVPSGEQIEALEEGVETASSPSAEQTCQRHPGLAAAV